MHLKRLFFYYLGIGVKWEWHGCWLQIIIGSIDGLFNLDIFCYVCFVLCLCILYFMTVYITYLYFIFLKLLPSKNPVPGFVRVADRNFSDNSRKCTAIFAHKSNRVFFLKSQKKSNSSVTEPNSKNLGPGSHFLLTFAESRS